MLYEDKAPYLLTLLFSALAWTVSQVAADAARSPILEYEQNTAVTNEQVKNVFTLTNISAEKALSNVTIKLRIRKGSDAVCVGRPEMQIPPPTELSDPAQKAKTVQPEYVGKTCGSFKIPKLQPGGVVQVAIETNSKTPVDIYVWSDDAVKVVEASLQTRVIKNKFAVMVCLIIVWSSLIIVYLNAVSRRNSNKQDSKEVPQ